MSYRESEFQRSCQHRSVYRDQAIPVCGINVNDTTVIINETSPGNFDPPTLIDEPWLEDLIIHWPIDMDLYLANRLKEAAGFTKPYETVTLRNPLEPKPGNPLFIFGDGSSQFIFVDIVTGDVTIGN
ncbi:hypothetical protein F8M41_008303 [Gigaspora margarita]|uniref:Uncharacterized protein n=1 Tax=Gigaspora margarita TaxID=4874 RepID=A0A8H3X532_GIGMA|nr:hypothetical protein F8M41_008303 [Gigaspora margarita]